MNGAIVRRPTIDAHVELGRQVEWGGSGDTLSTECRNGTAKATAMTSFHTDGGSGNSLGLH